ncbi:MAG: hypothetical protein TREMPRED_006051 [Tremellales sp. Tagirdzhanova-0007]|nr:MAG: hypothetical protein TREMPRED_006051 [Tremellales sp. Tagirdzhanova-0007]
MPQQRTKAGNASGLGKAIINRRAKEAHLPKQSQLYALDESNPLQSVTHERDLDEFLANAALADADFTTERSKLRIVAPSGGSAVKNPFLLSEDEARDVAKRQVDFQHGLTVPRRPPWTRQTTRQELERQERESFLDWRRELAQLSESSNLLLTPFERNVQLWRQLWRVLERSHLIVQIVDARNPLGFRCVDLENYVREVGDDKVGGQTTVPGRGKRRSLLLVNKADLLTYDQRLRWAEYFESTGVAYAFFSATDAVALLEQAAKQRRREAGDYEEEELEEDSDEEDDEERDEEDDDQEIYESDEVESDDDDELLAMALAESTLEIGDEDGWSTEPEDEDVVADGEVEKRLANGERMPLKEVVHEIVKGNGVTEEEIKTRVLSITELEDLFESAAPSLEDFATSREPTPAKLVVGLVGYPNVGKSSTINALLGAKKVSVSSTPGKTKHFQTLVLSDRITLCDCPGLVFPQYANTQADLIVDGVLPIDQMREYSAPVDLVCHRIPREILEGTYGIRIDVKPVEEGGSGRVGWEDLLSTYAIARGMTRSSFGMPDTSRAARYILKDYVNAKILYAHPPPCTSPDEFMRTSRDRTLSQLEEDFQNGRKRAPVTHVGKSADTFVQPAFSAEPIEAEILPPSESWSESKQLTARSVRANAASAPMRSGKDKSEALDGYFFTEAGPAPRPVLTGRNHGGDQQEGGLGYSRPMQYPHQRMLGPDGMPILDSARKGGTGGGKKHFKGREGKKRSGRGYD